MDSDPTTGQGIVVDGQGNVFFAGFIGTFGDPNGTTDEFVGRLNADGSTFGQFVGGYGIEIDATTPLSPPGTTVVAQIPDLYGPGIAPVVVRLVKK